MSDKLSAALLWQWGEPVWRLRHGGPPEILQPAENAAEKNTEKAEKSPEKPSLDVFQGFFVPEALDASCETLLRNIQRVFPQLGERHGFDEVDTLLMAEAGRAVVFGAPAWVTDVADFPVAVVVLPALDEMLEQPQLKKRVYFQLLDLFQQL